MSNSDTRIDSILAALERFSSSLSQQLEFNQQTDQRIANLVNRLNQHPPTTPKPPPLLNPPLEATLTPTKRRPDPHSAVAHTLQDSQASVPPSQTSSTTPECASQIPPNSTLHDWFGNPVSTQDMDITPDFASNASASEGSRSSSPISDAVDLSQ
ncbi:hypothetical protein HMPREF1544_08880 [Mucor circinelloides 1006PhL]|uniref:Uncharacterized protein n=1 Tax=Mucor circinelloides f. circinelloides (strain 1006PhL) TaxID=1220926 RepID=S2J2U9_MUCC1|nr:hypothetical protein HMPREF1544_08880 [Mucor circinelloides 1006PhL]